MAYILQCCRYFVFIILTKPIPIPSLCQHTPEWQLISTSQDVSSISVEPRKELFLLVYFACTILLIVNTFFFISFDRLAVLYNDR